MQANYFDDEYSAEDYEEEKAAAAAVYALRNEPRTLSESNYVDTPFLKVAPSTKTLNNPMTLPTAQPISNISPSTVANSQVISPGSSTVTSTVTITTTTNVDNVISVTTTTTTTTTTSTNSQSAPIPIPMASVASLSSSDANRGAVSISADPDLKTTVQAASSPFTPNFGESSKSKGWEEKSRKVQAQKKQDWDNPLWHGSAGSDDIEDDGTTDLFGDPLETDEDKAAAAAVYAARQQQYKKEQPKQSSLGTDANPLLVPLITSPKSISVGSFDDLQSVPKGQGEWADWDTDAHTEEIYDTSPDDE